MDAQFKSRVKIVACWARRQIKRVLRALLRPRPDYKLAILAIDNALAVLAGLRDEVLFRSYTDIEPKGQGPRGACPSAPVEDDPA